MSIKTPLLTIISVVAVAAAATFTSSDAEKLDADSASSLAATAETFTSFNQTAMASFPLSNAESDAMAAAFLPCLFLLRLKRRLVQYRDRKRNHSIPPERRFKPALLWTTALLMAGILTTTALLANPLGLLLWIERGKKVWTIISTTATLYTVGSALHVLVGSKPGNTGAKMKATPSIYEDHPNYQSPTVQRSGASDGSTWGSGITELSDESLAGNYASYYYDYYWVDYDEETGECSSRPHATHERATAGGVYSEPRWISQAGWDWLYAHSESAQRENPISTIDDPDIWARAGFWVHYASSSKYEYPDIPLESRISNPSWRSSNIDGDLKAKAKELGYTYDAKLHAKLIPLTWVAGKNGEDGKSGHWTEGATWYHDEDWTGVKGYEDDFTTIEGKDICPPNNKMEKLIGCRGGIKIWWKEIVEDKQTTVLNQAIDANGNRTGPITTNTVVLPHHKWVTRHKKESTDR